MYLGWSQARRRGMDNYLGGSPPIESWFAMRMMKGINQVQGLQQALQGEDKVKTVSRSGAIRITAFVVFGVLCHVVSVSRQYHGVE
ncbi:hypothetical protein Bca101_073900 [Brassica carinata]